MVAIPETLHPSIRLPMAEVEAFCRKWGITKLEVFGSALRDDFDLTRSDVDFLYTLAPDSNIGWSIGLMAEELSAILGRETDLVCRESVERSENWIRRPAILKSARCLYEA